MIKIRGRYNGRLVANGNSVCIRFPDGKSSGVLDRAALRKKIADKDSKPIETVWVQFPPGKDVQIVDKADPKRSIALSKTELDAKL